MKILASEATEIVDAGILIDYENLEDSKVLLQAFTMPVFSNGAFFEFIQRRNGSIDFGRHNVKALWEGIEQTESH